MNGLNKTGINERSGFSLFKIEEIDERKENV